MIRGLYRSATGMLTQEVKQENISNNLANVNTAGYKKDEAVFKSFPEELLHKIGHDKTGKLKDEIIGTTSNGVYLDDKKTIFTQGKLKETGNKLNFALVGEGFFSVDNENEGVRYTRNGEFRVDEEGYIVTAANKKVLGKAGHIKLNSDNVEVLPDGSVYENNKKVDEILITTFTNPESLMKIGDNEYIETVESQRTATGNYKIKQGFIETANVDLVKEMVKMLELVRIYESNQKALKAHDEILRKAVNEVGSLK